uniref:Uncharacterized protein n=1 Tax=Timema shepardi TaxID=629360 RepID=A0A7R9B5S6_TIMSH|nr:unnamed protein product [Timema shepardi]
MGFVSGAPAVFIVIWAIVKSVVPAIATSETQLTPALSLWYLETPMNGIDCLLGHQYALHLLHSPLTVIIGITSNLEKREIIRQVGGSIDEDEVEYNHRRIVGPSWTLAPIGAMSDEASLGLGRYQQICLQSLTLSTDLFTILDAINRPVTILDAINGPVTILDAINRPVIILDAINRPVYNPRRYQQTCYNPRRYQQTCYNPRRYHQTCYNPRRYQQTCLQSSTLSTDLLQSLTISTYRFTILDVINRVVYNPRRYQQTCYNPKRYQQTCYNPRRYQQTCYNPRRYQQTCLQSSTLSTDLLQSLTISTYRFTILDAINRPVTILDAINRHSEIVERDKRQRPSDQSVSGAKRKPTLTPVRLSNGPRPLDLSCRMRMRMRIGHIVEVILPRFPGRRVENHLGKKTSVDPTEIPDPISPSSAGQSNTRVTVVGTVPRSQGFQGQMWTVWSQTGSEVDILVTNRVRGGQFVHKQGYKWTIWSQTRSEVDSLVTNGSEVDSLVTNKVRGGQYGHKQDHRWTVWSQTGSEVDSLVTNRVRGGQSGHKQGQMVTVWSQTGSEVDSLFTNITERGAQFNWLETVPVHGFLTSFPSRYNSADTSVVSLLKEPARIIRSQVDTPINLRLVIRYSCPLYVVHPLNQGCHKHNKNVMNVSSARLAIDAGSCYTIHYERD